MSKVQILHGMPARRTADAWRYLDSLGLDVDPATGEVSETPDQTRVRRENLERMSARNPAPTLSPQVQRRIRHDLEHGSYHGGPGGSAA